MGLVVSRKLDPSKIHFLQVAVAPIRNDYGTHDGDRRDASLVWTGSCGREPRLAGTRRGRFPDRRKMLKEGEGQAHGSSATKTVPEMLKRARLCLLFLCCSNPQSQV